MPEAQPSADPERAPGTSELILAAAMRLFAEQGYRDTTIADIETAAGLAPRAGTLYKHFAGKEQLLRACIEQHVTELDRLQDAIEMLPLGDLRAELTLIGRWNMADLSRRQSTYQFIAREGDRFPDLRDRVRDAMVDRPLRRVAGWLRDRAVQSGVRGLDCEALALVMVQSMASYRALETTYGATPLEVGEARFLEMWVECCLGAAQRAGIALQPELGKP